MVQEKKIITKVTGWLTLFDDGSVDRTWSGPPEVKFLNEAVPPHDHFVDGVATADVTSPTASSSAYTYPRSTKPTRRSSPCSSTSTAAASASPPPIGTWVSGAGGYPGRRVFLIGDSSGGNVVHEVAARAGEEGIPVAGAIPMHPGFCRAGRSRSEVENPETPFLTVEMIDGLLEGETKDHPITCPMGDAAGEGGASAVLVLLGGAGFDVGYADGVLRGDEEGGEGGGAVRQQRRRPLLLP
ncbi:hypothetical protein SASPL_100724 [Salvia splendens]|uniref:Alpha/beta hydrolase fold-3 domain-containing protein n=1 Tax=Salvia splendens TaxID=180675 RepID=A0A8X8YTH1_SALSN|nr:hypothetical protein SASPL_100724 [Salvia splendens]